MNSPKTLKEFIKNLKQKQYKPEKICKHCEFDYKIVHLLNYYVHPDHVVIFDNTYHKCLHCNKLKLVKINKFIKIYENDYDDKKDELIKYLKKAHYTKKY